MTDMMTSTKNSEKIKVLDKGFVQYVSHMGDDLTVANAARVSFNKESEWEIDEAAKQRLINSGSIFNEKELHQLSQRDERLISYLAKHKHWTPFAHPQITLRIKAPIFVRTQLFKHKVGFTENEISRRYVTFEPEIYIPQWRSAPTDGAKQGSSGFLDNFCELDELYVPHILESVKLYNKLLENNVAPEQARSVLPQGTYTEWWWTGSLAAYARVFAQRIDTHAQWEVQQYAAGIGKIIEKLYPVSWKVLTQHD